MARETRPRSWHGVGIALGVLAVVGLAVATDWEEPAGDDAGSDPAGAQAPAPANAPILTISGSLGFDAGPSIERGLLAIDYEDLYLIFIPDPSLFSAQVVASATDFNAQLWLFHPSGFAMLGNDRGPIPAIDAVLLPQANDGTDFMIPGPGVYLLGISGLGNTPKSTDLGGVIREMFAPIPLPPGEISGPDGLGGGFQLSGWSAQGEVGLYKIQLQGVRAPIGPCLPDVTTTNTNPGDLAYGFPDGVVNGADLSFYVEAWLGGQLRADFTTTNTNPGDIGFGWPDNVVNGADLSFYVENWLVGCQ